jgi:hypothetical protein
LARNDRRLSHRLFKADGAAHCAFSLKGTAYSPTSNLGEGHLAVDSSTACFILLIVHLAGRCIAVREDERMG